MSCHVFFPASIKAAFSVDMRKVANDSAEMVRELDEEASSDVAYAEKIACKSDWSNFDCQMPVSLAIDEHK
jgi:hypothetical protein